MVWPEALSIHSCCGGVMCLTRLSLLVCNVGISQIEVIDSV